MAEWASASLRLFSKLAFRFLAFRYLTKSRWISKDWAIYLHSLSVTSAAPVSGLHSDYCGALLSLLGPVLFQLFSVLLIQLMVLGLHVCHDPSEVLRLGASNFIVNLELAIWHFRPFTFSSWFFMKGRSSLWSSISMPNCRQMTTVSSNLVESMDVTLHRLAHSQVCLILDYN